MIVDLKNIDETIAESVLENGPQQTFNSIRACASVIIRHSTCNEDIDKAMIYLDRMKTLLIEIEKGRY